MSWKPALIRAVRTLLAACLAVLLSFYLAVKEDGTFINIKAHGEVLLFGFFLALVLAVVTLLHNLLEDNTEVGRKVPKG